MSINIESIKRKTLIKYPFFGSVVANVDYKENNNIKTAGTNGQTIYYNPTFIEELSIDEQIFVFAHEICHIAFNHILRSKDKDFNIWNTATDAVINAFLKKDGLKPIEGIIEIDGAINYDAEELYNKLLQEQHPPQENNESEEQKIPPQPSTTKNPNNQKHQDVGHDTHNMWEEAAKNHQDSQNSQNTIEKLGEKAAFQKNTEEKKKALEKLKQDLSKQALGAGDLTNKEKRNITNIGHSNPLIDWRYILKEATKYDVDWSYKNATIENGVIVPHLEEQPVVETEILLDTSGSINEVLLKSFLRECKNILPHSQLKVGCFDTIFYGFHEIKNENDIENMELLGGGGTNFTTAISAFSRRAENKIIFTDGDAIMPTIPFNAIWIVFGEIKINPKGGKVIQINNEQLKQLFHNDIQNHPKGRTR